MPINDSKLASKVANSPAAHKAKVAIRTHVLDHIGADKASVFDAFAGTGEMFDGVWKGAARYTGCDLKWQRDGRRMFCADNRRVLRSLDLKRFNVFDLDAYGSPWEQAIIIADRRPVKAGERIALVITEGNSLSFRNSIMPFALGLLVGMKPGQGEIMGLNRRHDAIVNRAIIGLARRMRCDVVKRWQAEGKRATAMRYIGLILEGRKHAAQERTKPQDNLFEHRQAAT